MHATAYQVKWSVTRAPHSTQLFRDFNKEWDIIHNPTSPLFPRANGQVERTIQTIKATMTKALCEGKELSVVLLNYRATPMNGLASPAEMLMGRRIRTLIPAHPRSLLPHYPHALLHKKLKARQQAQHKHGDQHAQVLPLLQKKQPVWYWHGKKWEKAVVTQVGPEPRRYRVTAPNGQTYTRNRHHLRVRTSSRNPQVTAEDYYPVGTTVGASHPEETSLRCVPSQPQHRATRSGRTVRVPSRYLL